MTLDDIHWLIRRFYFAENTPGLSRILFKDSDLKKMGRMDNFMKVNSYAINPSTLTKSGSIGKNISLWSYGALLF